MISLVATVLNEGQSIHRLMRSIAAQTRLPDEVVIVDGGSHDETVSLIQSYAAQLPLKVLVEAGCNISAGRNRAIAAAQGDIIAVTDAGVELSPDWLDQLTQPLRDDPAVQAVGGFFHAQPQTLFELAMGATVLPMTDEVKPETFLPSSRSAAFRKSAWEAIGGYPEWLDYCEDLIFDLRLKVYCARQPQPHSNFVFVPTAIANFRPRGSFGAFFRQYYQYARGDGKANLWLKRHTVRYTTYSIAIIVLLVALTVSPFFLLLYIPGAVYYLWQPYRRLRILMRSPENRELIGSAGRFYGCILLVPLIRFVGDVAKMIGYPVGLAWRRNHAPPDWRKL